MPLVARFTLDPLLRVVTFVLIAISAVLLGRLTWGLLEPSSVLPAAGIAPPMAQDSAGPASVGGFRQLAALSVLGASAAQPVVVNVPDTTLSWALKGVLSDPDSTRSFAILAPQGQREKLYRVGDALPGNVRLEQILPDQVILARDGKLETLRLKRAQAGAPRAATNNTPARAPAAASIAADGGVARIDREGWANDPQRFMDVITASPVMQDGALYGLEVHPARNLREFEAAGLEAGDVIIAVEGRPVGEINDYRDLLQELGDASSLSVSLERNGEPLNITITMD
ncbi:type II secretion system protein GspC [Pseudomonas sp.]|uniref:type II secretion system protein GspC n=1 Tax=Pseudomonas sp. TaxID=306 RepID=UPI00272D777F|nr:type II secretion system protein GspC [Pseudomonas sp.]